MEIDWKKRIDVGRVAFVDSGPLKGKLGVIVDFIDYNRGLFEGPATGVSRQPILYNQIRLTKLKLKIPPSAPTKTVQQQWNKENILEKFAETKLAQAYWKQEKRASLNDFERFKVRRLKVLQKALMNRTDKLVKSFPMKKSTARNLQVKEKRVESLRTYKAKLNKTLMAQIRRQTPAERLERSKVLLKQKIATVPKSAEHRRALAKDKAEARAILKVLQKRGIKAVKKPKKYLSNIDSRKERINKKEKIVEKPFKRIAKKTQTRPKIKHAIKVLRVSKNPLKVGRRLAPMLRLKSQAKPVSKRLRLRMYKKLRVQMRKERCQRVRRAQTALLSTLKEEILPKKAGGKLTLQQKEKLAKQMEQKILLGQGVLERRNAVQSGLLPASTKVALTKALSKGQLNKLRRQRKAAAKPYKPKMLVLSSGANAFRRRTMKTFRLKKAARAARKEARRQGRAKQKKSKAVKSQAKPKERSKKTKAVKGSSSA